MRTAQSDDRTLGRFSARSRQEGGASPPLPVRCDTCGVAGCAGECGAVAGERERTDIGAGLWIVIVGLAFLLCPGCAADDGRASVLEALAVGTGIALVVMPIRVYLRRGRLLRDAELGAKMDGDVIAKLHRRTMEAGAEINRLKAELAGETAKLKLANERCEQRDGWIREQEERAKFDALALDACARLLDDKKDAPGSGVYAEARSALRATGRLGGLQAASDAAVPVVRP